MGKRKLSLAALTVLSVFLADPEQKLYGFEIAKIANMGSGSLYPVLERFEEEYGWLTSEWENIDPVKEGRRPRRYYKLTAVGVQAGRAELMTMKQTFSSFGGVFNV